MEVFVAAVEAGSLSGAGRRLKMPLPTVSRKLADLEQLLGTRLLHRSTRALTLTDAGQAYLAACKKILDDVREAERAASGEYQAPTGELIITAPIFFGRLHVLPIVNRFLEAYPDVQIRLVLGDRDLNLIEEHIDLAIRIGELPTSNLIAARVGATRHVVCASPDYLARHRSPRTPPDLLDRACVTFGALSSSYHWSFRAGSSTTTIPVRSRLVVSTAEAAVDSAIAGIGITRVLSYQAANALQSGTLLRLLKGFETKAMPINLVYKPQPLLPLKLRAFLDFAKPTLRAAVAGLG
nr:LysR family transcriptional regulator [Hydrocarboniphaga sp.]